MKKRRMLFFVFTLLILSCNTLTQPLTVFVTPTPTLSSRNVDPDCPNFQPTQEDIDFALQQNDEFFSPPIWKTSYTVMEYQVTVTWKSDEFNSVANFDYIIFCKATNTALDDYYTTEAFDVIFQNYDEHELQTDCRSGDLRLYEYKVKNLGFDYNARFWVDILDENHIRQSLLVFPVSDSTNMDFYSKKIMPELTTCK